MLIGKGRLAEQACLTSVDSKSLDDGERGYDLDFYAVMLRILVTGTNEPSSSRKCLVELFESGA
jgi:hypothetical protein